MGRVREALGAAVGAAALGLELAALAREHAGERVAGLTWCAAVGCDGSWTKTTVGATKTCRRCRREIARWIPPR